jgi:hypothetical protein
VADGIEDSSSEDEGEEVDAGDGRREEDARYSLGIWSVGGKQKKKGKVEVVEKASLTSLRGLNRDR